MALNGAEMPQLILIQPFGLAFLVVDFNGPAVTANACNPGRLPDQAVADEKGRIVREVSLGIIDDQALFAKIVNMMGMAVAVVGFALALERDGELLEDRLAFLLRASRCSCLSRAANSFRLALSGLQVDFIRLGQGAHIGQLQGLIQVATEGRLSEPIVKGHRAMILWMDLHPLLEQILHQDQLTVIQLSGVLDELFWRLRQTPSK